MGEERGSCPGCVERDARIAVLEACNRAQAALNVELEDRLRRLEARLKQNSSNSSRPPSSDIVTSPKPKVEPSGRRPGGQPGHEPHNRPLLPPDKVDATVVVLPEECGRCSRRLPTPAGTPTDLPQRHQVVEIPAAPAIVTEYRLHALVCPDCGATTRAGLPPGVPEGCAGSRFQAILALLTGRFRLSRREAGQLAETIFGEKAGVSDGTIVEMEKRTSEALAPAYDEALERVRTADSVNCDETSWRQKTKKVWLWVAATATLAVFRIDSRRSRAAFERFLGAFAGVLCTDRYSAYARHALHLRQICWAHLKRDLQALVDRGGDALATGRWGLRAVTRIFGVWRDFKAHKFDRLELGLKGLQLKADFGKMLTSAAQGADAKARSLARDLRKLWPALWTFLEVEGVEPTNNHAERRIRPAVLWRKGSFGTQSEEGNRFVERMLTTVQSLRLQSRPVLDFIEQTIRAHRLGHATPSLLPAVQSHASLPVAATA